MPCSVFASMIVISAVSQSQAGSRHCTNSNRRAAAARFAASTERFSASLASKAAAVTSRAIQTLTRIGSSISHVKKNGSTRDRNSSTKESDASTKDVAETGADGEVTPVNFTGNWLLVAVEDDPYGLMEVTGVPYSQKTAGWAAGYGVNHVRSIIKQMGNKFSITSKTPIGKTAVKFVVGAGKQTAKASNGMLYKLKPSWSKNELHATLYKGGYVIQQRRFMRDGNMCIESAYGGKRSTEVYKLQ